MQIAPVDPDTGGSPVVLQFAAVASEGTTTLTTLETPEVPLPMGFEVGTITYLIETTAVFAGPIEICISYAGQDVGDESSLRIRHHEDGQWKDVTSRVDLVAQVVCGTTTSLSPFTVAKPTPTAVTHLQATASVFGGKTTMSARVTPAGVPGSVSFVIHGSGAPVDAVYNPATEQWEAVDHVHGLGSRLAPYDVRAVFTANRATEEGNRYANSQDTQAVLLVGQAPATVTFGTAPTPTYLGGSFTVTASTTNTDSLALTYSVVSGLCTLTSGSTFASTGAGACEVKASGAATANFTAAEAQQTVTVAKAPTSVALSSGSNPSSSGQAVTFTATVTTTGGAAVVVGQVTFKEGDSVLSGPISVDVSGRAVFTTNALTSGTHPIAAEFGTTANYLAGTGSVTQTVTSGSVPYTFTGFFAPIDMPAGGASVVNSAKAGQTIPVKWNLKRGVVPVSDPASFAGIFSSAVGCTSGAVSDEIEEYAPGASSLQYKDDGNWQYNWGTGSSYKGTCRVVYVKLKDGANITNSPLATFKFK